MGLLSLLQKMHELNDNRFTCFTRNYIELINLHDNVSFHKVSVVEVQLDKIR
ncbi:hypothetical protein PDR90_25935 [Bacillus cereus group sp. Bc007]|nr:hypothetical protein [Bacillus cereus group sp. Bc007]